MRTYTQYVTDGRETLLCPQAIVMGQFILHGRTQTVKELCRLTDVENGYVSGVCCILANKGYLERRSRGKYRITRLGRAVFEPVVTRVLNRRIRRG